MFETLLIANRGEIACRIIRTARRLGIRTVAVYSDADAHAPHVRHADEAHRLGPAPVAESYLRGPALMAALTASGAQAVHPGYGFLSENAAFAEAVEKAGAVFVGPPAAAIRAMGSKAEAKRIMAEAGVPLVPGYHDEDQDPATLAAAAEEIGYPVLIKATAGGGGKGMRAVTRAEDFAAALTSCRREAAASFGDDRCLVEKLVTQPRHVEIQVFADRHGNAVHLFERDCSLQRRHQKVIEEAPAPGMSTALRAKMGAAAVAAAQAIGYVGAGTVEFLLDADQRFYFMEMNTRLQVEHPITEMITGQDLVEWQLRVAAGAPLPLTQEQIALRGHAFEARLYAEDPHRDFLPATGRLAHLRLPDETAHIRIDSGVEEGGEVSIHYDPMIAKVIVWDQDRPAALRRLGQALAATEVVGVTTNVDFLAAIAAHPDFAAGEVDTGFIARHAAALIPESRPPAPTAIALAALDVLLRRDEEARAQATASADPHSPWHLTNGWRLNDDNHHRIVLIAEDGHELAVVVHYRGDGYKLDLPDAGTLDARAERTADGLVSADLDGRRISARVVGHGADLIVLDGGRSTRFTLYDPLDQAQGAGGAGGGLTAPMPGRIIAVPVTPGQRVTAGDTLMIMEAMKMEHTITAPTSGTVAELYYAVGDQVEDGAALLAVDED